VGSVGCDCGKDCGQLVGREEWRVESGLEVVGGIVAETSLFYTANGTVRS
jgi:hypothetical protein